MRRRGGKLGGDFVFPFSRYRITQRGDLQKTMSKRERTCRSECDGMDGDIRDSNGMDLGLG